MKDNMPTLKEIFDSDKELENFGLQFLLFYSVGYTAEDFKAYAEEMLADDDTDEVIKALKTLFEYGLKELKRSMK